MIGNTNTGSGRKINYSTNEIKTGDTYLDKPVYARLFAHFDTVNNTNTTYHSGTIDLLSAIPDIKAVTKLEGYTLQRLQSATGQKRIVTVGATKTVSGALGQTWTAVTDFQGDNVSAVTFVVTQDPYNYFTTTDEQGILIFYTKTTD